MSTKITKAVDPDTETIEMLDTLGYLRNGSEIWTMVSKDFDLAAAQPFSTSDFECGNGANLHSKLFQVGSFNAWLTKTTSKV